MLIAESVPHASLLTWLYTRPLGRFVRWIISKKWWNLLCGWVFSTHISTWYIRRFAREHNVDIDACEKPLNAYPSFNAFFTRKLKKGARIINKESTSITSPADSKLFVIPRITEKTCFYLKHHTFNLKTFLANETLAHIYTHASLFIFRLASGDYHRYHFPVAGQVTYHTSISGRYESAQQCAYWYTLPLVANHRIITQLDVPQYSPILLISVGALCVGSIIETYPLRKNFHLKGSEMGFFAFGGSTIALLIPSDKINIREDLLRHSEEGYETAVYVGEAISHWRKQTDS